MLEPKTVSQSQVTMSQLMVPTDANPSGNVHGGTIMKQVDTAGGVAAHRHARSRVVTARIDSMNFLSPVFVGDLVTVKASVNDVGSTSMEVGVRVDAENLRTGEVRHISSAYLVYVALDEAGRPRPAPPVVAETSIERRRQSEARLRREHRQRGEASIRSSRQMGENGTGRLRRPAGARPLITGHRGASGHAPENTMASFALGLELGADLIELDVQMTRDGHLVVLHDPTVDRTTNGRGWVKDLTLAEIKALDAGSWFGKQFAGERVPTLAEALRWARGQTRLAIEVKNGPVYYPGMAEKVVTAVREEGMEESTVVISFDHYVLRQIKELNPRLATGVLYAARPIDAAAMARAALAEAILPAWPYVTPEVVQQAAAADLAVHTWNIDDPALLPAILALGVDAIGSNYPDRVKKAIDEALPVD